MRKGILLEVALLIALLAFSALVQVQLTSFLSVNIHDTYYVVNGVTATLLLFTFLVSIVYLARILAGREYSGLTSWIQLIGTAGFLFFITSVAFWLNQVERDYLLLESISGWTVHPPLSTDAEVLSEVEDESGLPRWKMMYFNYIFPYLQLPLLLVIIWGAVRIGKHSRSRIET